MPQMTPIGTIHSPFTARQGMPIQPAGAREVRGTVQVFEEYLDGLHDLDGFSHLILIYQFHRSEGYQLRTTPFMDEQARGLFATRAPKRPNPIGLSVVRLDDIQGGVLHIRGVDVLDGTPLLDIKPFVPRFDIPPGEIQTGWLEQTDEAVTTRRSDDRFE